MLEYNQLKEIQRPGCNMVFALFNRMSSEDSVGKNKHDVLNIQIARVEQTNTFLKLVTKPVIIKIT